MWSIDNTNFRRSFFYQIQMFNFESYPQFIAIKLIKQKQKEINIWVVHAHTPLHFPINHSTKTVTNKEKKKKKLQIKIMQSLQVYKQEIAHWSVLINFPPHLTEQTNKREVNKFRFVAQPMSWNIIICFFYLYKMKW